MAKDKFDVDAFFSALDAERLSRDLTWKRIAEESKVPASTLTRMSQGKRPDVDTLTALCAWSGLKIENFSMASTTKKRHAQPLTQLIGHLRADPNLTPEGARALETLIKTAYKQFRR